MDADEVAELRVLLTHARTRALAPEERSRYLAACQKLEEALNNSQLLLAPAGAKKRRRFRVPCSLPVSLQVDGSWREARTVNLSGCGFCALTAAQTPVGARVPFRIEAPGAKTIEGAAVCRNSWTLGTRCYSAFEFGDLDQADLACLELEVVAAAMELLWPSDRLEP